MKKLFLFFLLMISGVTFAQNEDEIVDFTRDSIPLTGVRQQISVNVYQKNIVINNSASDAPVYFCKMRDGVVDTTKNYISILAGEEKTIYNPTDTSIWIKGTAGKYVIIYVLEGRGRGVQKSPTGMNQAQINTAIAGYIDTSKVGKIDQNETVTGFWGFPKIKVGTGTSRGNAEITAIGDTVFMFRSPLFQDSSYFQMVINPFTGKVTLKLIGKNGSNMMTWDSTSITTTLQLTTDSYLLLGGASGTSIRSMASGRVGFYDASGSVFATMIGADLRLGGGSRGTLNFTADGVFSYSNAAANGFVTATWGAGNVTAGFFRGTTDTDITGIIVAQPNGTRRYVWWDDAGVQQSSTSIP